MFSRQPFTDDQYEIARQVDALVRDKEIMDKFRQMIREYARREEEHYNARRLARQELLDHSEKIKNDLWLAGKQPGPPPEGWLWRPDRVFGPVGWYPPPKTKVPEHPWFFGKTHREDLTLEFMLPAEYLLLTCCHDNLLPDRPPIITSELSHTYDTLFPMSGGDNPLAAGFLNVSKNGLEAALTDVQAEFEGEGNGRHSPVNTAEGLGNTPVGAAVKDQDKEIGSEYSSGEIRKEGNHYKISFQGKTTPLLDDILGMRYIAHLIRDPNEDISAIELERNCKRMPSTTQNADGIDDDNLVEVAAERDLGELVDMEEYTPEQLNWAENELKRQYDIETDPAKKAEIHEEIERIQRYLPKSKDIHGRGRKFADPLEKARKRVSSAIDTALTNIEPVHKELWRHLQNTIRKGGNFSYRPDTDIRWQF